MARFNEINVGHYNRFLQKATGIKGGPPVPQLGSEITPTLGVFSGAENRYLSAWNAFGNYQDVPAGAALVGGVQIRNPAGSNVLAVIVRIYFSAGAANTALNMSQPPPFPVADLGSAGPAIRAFDLRQSGGGGATTSSTCIVSSQNSPSVGVLNSVPYKVNAPVAFTDYDLLLDEDQQIPLLPGDAVRLTPTGANIQVKVGFVWRERYLEESERS
jgi:hypothetical protein